MTTITVAVATCGRPDGLARCLDALATATRRPDEVIVVDQAPSPASHAAIANASVPVRHLLQGRTGLSASRNLALDRTTTDVLAVTDDDCVPDPGWVACIHDVVSEDDLAVLTGPILALGPRPPGGFGLSLRDGKDDVVHRQRVLPWLAGSGANLAASVPTLRAVGGWDERLGTGSPGKAAEDIALLDDLLRRGVPIAYDTRFVLRHEWADRRRRLATRWTYGHGLGAFLALRARDGDRFAARMLSAWTRPHAAALVTGLRRRDRDEIEGHARALVGMVVGIVYGIRVHGHPRRGPTTESTAP